MIFISIFIAMVTGIIHGYCKNVTIYFLQLLKRLYEQDNLRFLFRILSNIKQLHCNFIGDFIVEFVMLKRDI